MSSVTPKIRPYANGLLVKPEEKQQKTAGGIVLPSGSNDTIHWGKVLAVGQGALNHEGQRIPVSFHVGDRILFGQHSGTKVKIDSVDYVFIREDEVLGVEEV